MAEVQQEPKNREGGRPHREGRPPRKAVRAAKADAAMIAGRTAVLSTAPPRSISTS